MRAFLIGTAVILLGGLMAARADETISSVQQTLKEQGFYYGEITGTQDADTTAAIRRYQIRNGLKITGDLSPETQKSLGIRKSTSAAIANPAMPSPTVSPRQQPASTPNTSDRRAEESGPPSPAGRPSFAPVAPRGSAPGGAPGGPVTIASVFAGTPYELAPAEVQRQAIMGAQMRLAQEGYYRGAMDGAYGPETAFALRAFQARSRIAATGRFDLATLASLGLLPHQRQPGFARPTHGFYPQPRIVPDPGERVYTPR